MAETLPLSDERVIEIIEALRPANVTITDGLIDAVAAYADRPLPLEQTPAYRVMAGWRHTGNHGWASDCPACGTDCQTSVGIQKLVYTFEVCSCGNPEYDHLVEQLWHRDCWVVRESDEASGVVVRGARDLIAGLGAGFKTNAERRALDLIRRGLDLIDEGGPT